MNKLSDFQTYIRQHLASLPVTFHQCSYVEYAASEHEALRAAVEPTFITITAHHSTQCTVRTYPKPISKSFKANRLR